MNNITLNKHELVDSLFHGAAARLGISGVVYDTAWLACIPSADDPSIPQFPRSLEWLKTMQLEDGSWGSSEIVYPLDRIINTLAVLGTLGFFAHSGEVQSIIDKGVRYLWKNSHLLFQSKVEMIGTEMLIGSLVDRANKVDIAIPHYLTTAFEQSYLEKMKGISPEIIYNPASTLSYSIEFLGDSVDAERLKKLILSDGSVANSPAATAYTFLHTRDDRALAYLKKWLAMTGEGITLPQVAPIDRFEPLWSAYTISVAGYPIDDLVDQDFIHQVAVEAESEGMAYTSNFKVPDSDDTSVGLIVLSALGLPVKTDVLQKFESAEGCFKTFVHERKRSLSANIHVLHALLKLKEYPNYFKVINNLVDYVLSEIKLGLYWEDKWHLSPYYTTAHVLMAFSELPGEFYDKVHSVMQASIHWIRQTQSLDGSWGFTGISTGEETAYAVLALIKSAGGRMKLNEQDSDMCFKGVQYIKNILAQNKINGKECYPPLWIGKCLYTPIVVVRAALIAAIIAFEGIN